jgi:hypothetical protein
MDMDMELRKEEEEKEDGSNEKELANVVYIFASKDMLGIKFYDKSPYGAVAKLAGSLPYGKYKTDIHSISKVSWDDEINEPNESHLIKTKNGSYKATTIMVSLEQFYMILYSIEKAKDKNDITINIYENILNYMEDIGLEIPIKNIINKSEYDNFEKTKITKK